MCQALCFYVLLGGVTKPFDQKTLPVFAGIFSLNIGKDDG